MKQSTAENSAGVPAPLGNKLNGELTEELRELNCFPYIICVFELRKRRRRDK
jgi:hypothetical protein